MKCAALVYKQQAAYTILCKNGLPNEVELFVLLHEIGHISLGKICCQPQLDWSRVEETEVNLWALEKLKPYLKFKFYRRLRFDFSTNEQIGFQNIQKNLKQQLLSKRRKYGKTMPVESRPRVS